MTLVYSFRFKLEFRLRSALKEWLYFAFDYFAGSSLTKGKQVNTSLQSVVLILFLLAKPMVTSLRSNHQALGLDGRFVLNNGHHLGL
jgi:hypothetical protein